MTTKEGIRNTKLLNFAIAIHSFRHTFSVSGFYLKYLTYHTRCNKGYSLIHLEGQFICVLLLNLLLLDYKITSIIDRLQLMTSHFVTVWNYNRLRGGGCTYTWIWSYDAAPLWSHGCTLGTQQLGCIYGSLHHPMVMWLCFIMVILKTSIYCRFSAKLAHSKPLVC